MSYWDVIVPIIAAWVGNKYGNPQGDTPNQYPAILPPEMKRIADEAWRVYLAGGSPVQQDIRTLALQSAAQTPSEPPNFKFVSPELSGQSFAGGIKAPKFDLSKLPSLGGGGAPSLMSPPPGPGSALSVPGGKESLIFKKQPVDDESLYGDLARTHYGDTLRDPATRPGMDGLGRGGDDPNLLGNGGDMTYADGTAQWQSVQSWWADYQKEHPNWARIGAAAAQGALGLAFGLPGTAAGLLLKRLISGGAPAQPPPGPAQPPVMPRGSTAPGLPQGRL